MMATGVDIFADFEFVNFKKYSEGKRKLTRKRKILDAKKFDIYPPESHYSFQVASGGDLSIVCGGGARFRDGSWDSNTELYRFVFGCDPDDVWLNTITTLNTSGATLPPLSGAQAVFLPAVNQGILFGGLNLSHYSATNDLFTIDMNIRRNTVRVDLHYAEKPSGELLSSAKTQKGAKITPRFGHSLICMSDNKAVCFGGVTLHRRESVSVYAQNIFSHKCDDSNVYILQVDCQEATWRECTVNGPALLQSFHSAVRSSPNTVLSCGGIVTEGHNKRRAHLGVVHMYTFDEGYHSCTIQDVQITNAPDYGLSSHSMCLFNDTDVIIVGGYISKSVSDEYPEVSKSVHLLSLGNTCLTSSKESATSDGCTAGATIFRAGPAIIILGGTEKSISLFTKAIIHADSCALDKDCNIDSSTTSPIAWVQCDGCKLWFHLFCLGKTAIPSDQDWFCEGCMNDLKKKRQKTK